MAKKRSVTGFTLIELLVVIAIIGLLLAIIVPSLSKAKFIARRVLCAGGMNQVGVAMKLYADSNKEALPTNRHPESNSAEMHGYVAYRADWTYSTGKLVPLRFARLYESGLVDTPEIFYCPNNRSGTWKYESYVDPEPWGYLPQKYNTVNSSNQWVRIGLTYYPIERNAKILPAGYPDSSKVTKYTSLNINVPYATDVLHGLHNVSHQYNSKYDANNQILTYGKFALNCLYGDGRVTTCTDQAVFKDPIWGAFGDGTSDAYDRCYHTIFKLIGP